MLHLQAMVNEIPAVADQLASGLQQLADQGELHALASRLPFREQRISEFLTHRPVVADRFDVLTVMDRLEDAAKLAAELAVDLDRCATATVGRPQPGLLAAHAARAGAAQIDPHAALVEHVADGIDSGEQSTSTLRFELDDVAWDSEPECDVE